MPAHITLDASGLVIEPEGKTREYKRDLSSPRRPMRTIAAFANSAGGQLVVGIADDRTVVGVADPLAEEERVASLISDWIAPKLVPSVEIVPVGEKSILVVDVDLSGRRPHYIDADGVDDGTYVRLGTTTRKADPSLVRELQRGAEGQKFDEQPAIGEAVDDLDLPALESMLGRPVDEAVLKTLGLVVADQRRLVPTYGGVLVAGKNRERLFSGTWVQVARFRGDRRIDIFDQAEYHGHLPQVLDEVLVFLSKHAYKSAEFTGKARRDDVLSIPLDAIREVVVNAFVHASYETSGVNFKIAFLDDRIEVESPGTLLPGVTVEDIFRGVSVVRNPTIARFYRELGLVEQWGTGIPSVIEALAERGLPAPTIEELPGRLLVTIPIPLHRPSIDPRPGTVRGGGQSRSHQDESLSHQAESLSSGILDRLASAPAEGVARAELLAVLGLGNETRNAQRHIQPLIDAGLVALTIPNKPTSPKQRYVLTEAGRQALRS
ncbi:ATP-binding protein [Microcella flavibacter]|uniref:ATP-binding protein n=1 Tax=Microcella flavibacter TaxID=1804990 RepID=UPI0014565B02|nr:ATP-binding protein [Microcella flavibacter]